MNCDGFYNKPKSVFTSECITNTIYRKSFCFSAVCWGGSFKFLLQAYDPPDSGCLLPHLKALLLCGHWIQSTVLLPRLLPAHSAFFCFILRHVRLK